jgi:hypothetical protein
MVLKIANNLWCCTNKQMYKKVEESEIKGVRSKMDVKSENGE